MAALGGPARAGKTPTPPLSTLASLKSLGVSVKNMFGGGGGGGSSGANSGSTAWAARSSGS